MAKPQLRKPTAPSTPPQASLLGVAVQHAFKGLRDWVHIFSSGTHTDSLGRTASFTDGDLDEMVANVSGAGVPAVLGHPKDADPAYAWGRELKRIGEKLFAKFTDINPEFEAGVDSGAYRERSVKVCKDPQRGWFVEHVGWLGAKAPAIALQALAYSAPAAVADSHEFSLSGSSTGWALDSVATLLRGLRDWVISKDGLDVANQVLPDWAITSVAGAASRITADAMLDDQNQADADAMPQYSRQAGATASPINRTPGASPAGDPPMTITEADLQRARDETRVATEAQFASQGMELAELRAARQSERIGTQINGWKAGGLVTPAEEAGMAEFMGALEGGQAGEFAFSAADKSAAKKTPALWFAEFVASRKPVVRLGQRLGGDDSAAAPGTDNASDQEIAAAARNYQATQAKAGHHISIGSAIDAVTTGKAKA